jgi:hypothetical protein
MRKGHKQPKEASPSQVKYGKNGKTKIVRMKFLCTCGEAFHVLLGPRERSGTICPGCKGWKWTIYAGARLEEFVVAVHPWHFQQTGVTP